MAQIPSNDPLIPLPTTSPQPIGGNASSQSNSLLDLISSSPLEPTSAPIFPERKPAPAPAPRIPLQLSTPPLSAQLIDESLGSPGFGDFVSVPPAADPLATDGSTPIAEQPSESSFVQDAKARTAEKERQVMKEFHQSESSDPLGLLPEREPDLLLDSDTVEPVDTRPAILRMTSELKRTESAPALSAVDESSPAPPEASPSAASASATPILSLSGRLSLPRSWTSILSNSLPTLPTTSSVLAPEHTPHSHSPEHPIHGKLVREDSITHTNPFSHTFVAPSGAPGYTGEHWDKGFGDAEVVSTKSASRLKLVGRTEMTTPILATETAEKLRPSLPALRRLAPKWSLLYSLDQHGISLATFYARCEQAAAGGCLIAIRDAEGATFGAWCGDGVRKHDGYTGSGESFLWSQQQDGGPVKVFKWTGKNDYVRLCESDFISFGGGNGKFGLYLDSALLDGESAPCPTFDNEALCSHPEGTLSTNTVKFECVGIEAWSIV